MIDTHKAQHTIDQWRALAEKSLKGRSLESLSHITASQLAIDPLYTERPASSEALFPSPLKRWDNRLAVLGESNAEKNANVLAGLAGGISSLQLSLTHHTQGAQLTAVDAKTILNDVQLDIVPLSLVCDMEGGSVCARQFTANATLIESVMKDLGWDATKNNIAFNADPIGTMAATADPQMKVQDLLKELTELALHTNQQLTNSTAVCVNASCYHNAGGSIEQELVAAIATASIYLQAMLDAGMDAQSANDTLVFQFSCDADVLSNVVKLRVLKSLWYYVATKMGVENPHCQLVVESSRRMQSLMEPWINHLRNVSCATAAAMGGAQTILIHPHDYIDHRFFNQSTDKDTALSARVARNIPIIISEESNLTFVHDPMAGAYSVENLSANLSNDCWQALQKLERAGGLIDALQSGQYQAQINQNQQQRIERLQNETDIQVGVNRYVNSANEAILGKTNTATDAPTELSGKALKIKRDAQAFEGVA